MSSASWVMAWLRPFQIDLLFLVNPELKNLPANQEKNKWAPEKKEA